MRKHIFVRLMILLIAMLLLSSCSGKEPTTDLPEDEDKGYNISIPEEEEGTINPLTGELALEYINPTIVMISNIPEARPATGLVDADIVYEVEMEGGITRFVALFYGDPPKIAGPVRSARPYVIQFAKEWDAYFVHVGGSEDGFAAIRRWGVRDIDNMRVGKGFFLDKTRYRPHNTYFNFNEGLWDMPENGRLPSINFVEDYGYIPHFTKISMKYYSSGTVEYKWNNTTRKYDRYMSGQAHRDRDTGVPVTASNVIIQHARHLSSGDEYAHIEVELIGSGNAEYFLGCVYNVGTWSKSSLEAPTLYYDKDGKEIKRAKGNTIVQVVRTNAKVEKFSNQ